MKYLTIFIFIFFSVIASFVYLPFNFALMSVAFLLAVSYGLIIEIRERRERLLATNRYDDYFIVSMHPETEKQVYFGEFQKYITSVPFNKVEAEKMRIEELLYLVSNEWIDPDRFPSNKLLRVHTYIYQHGSRVSEDWEEFEEYVLSDMKKKLEVRHEWMSKYKPVWYSKVKDKQTDYGVSWLSVLFARSKS